MTSASVSGRQGRNMRTAIAAMQGRGFTVPSTVALAIVLSILWLFGNAGQVHACKCVQPGTPSEEMEKFAAVFAGRVVSIEHSFDPDAATVSPDDRTTVGVEVSTVWKGIVNEDLYVTTPPTGGSCGFAFTEGEEYILYAHDSAYDGGGYTVSICSRTALLSQAQVDIDAFGDGDAPLAGAGGTQPEHTQGTAESSVWVVMAGAAAAILLLGGLSAVVWVRRR